MTQDQLNQIAQLKQDAMRYELYGTVYLKQTDGTIVLRYPDGSTGPIPLIPEYSDEECF